MKIVREKIFEAVSELKKRVIKIIEDSYGDDVKICLVDGDFVRSKSPGFGFIEFVEGRHYYVDSYPGYKKFIPEDEIWIDDVHEKKPHDLRAILQHEYTERNLMKYKKWSYEKAHEYSNEKEADYRKRK